MIRARVVGAGGYGGIGVIDLLVGHPEVEIVSLVDIQNVGLPISRKFPHMEGFCDLLEGDVNFPAVMRELRAIGYAGPCVAEFFGLDEVGLRKLSRAMDRILAM